MSKRKKKNIFTAIGSIALAILLGVSTYISLVVLGVVADEDRKGTLSILRGADTTEQPPQDEAENDYMNDYIINNTDTSQGESQNTNNDVPDLPQNNQGNEQGSNGEAPVENPQQPINTLLDTNKSKADIVKIYADVMNNAKSKAPGFTKIEYQEFPSDPASRVVTEGAESIDTVFGFVDSLGLIATKEEAEAEPYIHQKGDSDMSLFPVLNMPKGSYLTDPEGIESYSYKLLSNGNIKMTFILVSEVGPEPIVQGSEVAPSYTGAVFSPMSKAKIDNTVNHPIVGAFAKDIKYSLRYHDCKVEVEFNPENLQIVNLLHIANVTLKGSGDVVLGGKMSLEKQELITTLIIKDLVY